MKPKSHWETVYATKDADQVSWFQEHAELSLKLITRAVPERDARIIDVGGGASTLIDDLLNHRYKNLAVLDIAASGLEASRIRLGAQADLVDWLVADVLAADLPRHSIELWHDRAVFHFLTSEAQRLAYVATVLNAVKPGGHVIVSTFAEDGPTRCSGLPVMRYSASALHAEFGAPFTLLHQEKEAHDTPFGTTQQFVYCWCRTALS